MPRVRSKRDSDIEDLVKIRDTFEAQLPIVAAILAIGQDELDFKELAEDAISLCAALEEELS